jgi:hypothetical protein
MSRFVLDRRAVLRGLLGGAAVSVGLPPLEAMLGVNGEALADGTALPTRFGVWFWGNGVRPERWVPATTGTGWSPSDELAPLAAHQAYVSVVSGLEIKTATHPHHSGMTGIMTGRPYHQLGTTRDTIVTTFAGQSVDQIAADHVAGLTPFRSLELGVTRFRGTDEGSTFQHLSHNGPNSPNPSEYDAMAVYQRLFGAPADPQLDLARRSVLDAVGGQIGRLQRQIGASDRVRLEQHLESVRTLELRLAAEAGACGAVAAPEIPSEASGLEPIEEKNELMSRLLALALACDLTRVFSLQWSTAGSGVVVWQVGATQSLHYVNHNEAPPAPTAHAATTFTMENLGFLLQTLRDTPEGDGNLLDRCSILCTSELTEGWTHSNEDFPILVAGKGGGRLRGGVHARSTSAGNTSTAVLSALHGAGIERASFGQGAGEATTLVSELFS